MLNSFELRTKIKELNYGFFCYRYVNIESIPRVSLLGFVHVGKNIFFKFKLSKRLLLKFLKFLWLSMRLLLVLSFSFVVH